MKNDICNKDYSTYVDVAKYSDKNPDKRDHNRISRQELDRLWEMKDDPYYQIVLMLVYNGCRISEFLNLKKSDIHLDEQYFDVIASKTDNGLRKVPIADKVLPFYKAWYDSSDGEYLVHKPDGGHFTYDNYYDSYWQPLFEQLDMDHKPHDTRHTCISMLADAHGPDDDQEDRWSRRRHEPDRASVHPPRYRGSGGRDQPDLMSCN